MKLAFGLNNKEYNNYYHGDGTSLGIDNLDCGSDGKCEFNYIDDPTDGSDLLFTAPVLTVDNDNWEEPDSNDSENDGINGKNIYTSNGIMIDAMYHGNYGVGFDFHLLMEQRNYTFLSDIVDRNLEYHPYHSYAEDFETQQDLTHYDFGVYYVWNEILDKKDTPLLNTENYTFPTTRILTGLYFKGSDNQTLNSNTNSIYMLGAMDFIIHDRIILSNQLIVDYSDKDNISPCSIRSKLIWNINSKMALAPSFTYKKYDSIEIADSDIYEGFIMVEGAYQFLDHNFGNLDYDIKLIPYFMMSILGSENLIHAKNELGLNLKVFFN